MSYNTPVRLLQQGSVEEVAASGTLLVSTGGSIQIASGANINVAAASGINFQSGVTIGGTLGRWAFGTVGIASGVGTFPTGLTRVVSAVVNPILGEAQGAGSAVFALVDLSLSGAGSVIARLGSVGGALWAANGTAAWIAFGT